VLRKLLERLNSQNQTKFHVQAVENGYFGGDVSVAGLLTGRDLLSAKGQLRGDFAIIPRQMLKSDEAVFLDGLTLSALERELALPVHSFDLKDFSDFVVSDN
ncbi:MAG TPA: DUF512 domain-containing protein, partial [Pyrinomonadaceae bacterium]